MRIPRDISGRQLAHLLEQYGYTITRQVGSHLRLTTLQTGEHHFTIPDHKDLRVGALNSILSDVADHLKIDRDILIAEIFK